MHHLRWLQPRHPKKKKKKQNTAPINSFAEFLVIQKNRSHLPMPAGDRSQLPAAEKDCFLSSNLPTSEDVNRRKSVICGAKERVFCEGLNSI